MREGRHPCAWADDHPDRYPEGVRYCLSWHGCEGRPCDRKKYAQAEAKRAGAEYRKFPGAPFANNPGGECKWCDDVIEDEKRPGRINRRRNWHTACLHEFELHTRREVQLPFIIERDGPACWDCRKLVGKWVFFAEVDPDRRRTLGPSWVRFYPPAIFVDRFTRAEFASGLEVDHDVALGLVAHLPPEERRAFFHPDNLRARCPDCHRIKTRQDVAKIKAARIERNAA